ncbi:hypothetical protein F7725_003742 [Dissostichus mawsoni]|uniref:Uncharacterized protein n=1 Tax=Dissostichus mawsoni TaxID=36200 RepID=A0A7J5YB47_DISMA|nr:hypothetical protein F7725_003742 [Dissostichus mawsoni]
MFIINFLQTQLRHGGFDGLHVTLRDLKRQIMGREKLRAGDCDLQITNAQNKEEFTDDDGSIPKGSSVIVRRIPIVGGKPTQARSATERSDIQTNNAFGAFKAMANLADVEGSEEDKIRVMMNQTGYDPTKIKARKPCEIKKSSGIPRSFMMEVDDPSVKGAMLTSCGRYAVPTIDAEAYAIGKKEKPPFVPRDHSESEDEEDPVPEELLCLICHDLLSDAVVIPCCGNSYCDDCIRSALLDSEDHVCPTCSQSDVSPDNLIANKFLRQAVDTFKKERGFTKSLKKGCSASQSQNPTPTLSPALTPPPLTVQIQPQKPLLLNHRQQDPLRQHSQAADTPPSSQVPTSPVSAPNTPSTSCQPVQSHLETPEKEAEEKTDDDSAAAVAPSAPVSSEELTDAPSQLIPLLTLLQRQSHRRQAVSTTKTLWATKVLGELLFLLRLSPGGWTELNTQQRPPSSSPYPATPPPLFPPLISTPSSQLLHLSALTLLDTHLPSGRSQTSRVPPSLPCAPPPPSLRSSPRSGTCRERRRGHLTEDLPTDAPPLVLIQSLLSPSLLAPTRALQAGPDPGPGPKGDQGPTHPTPTTGTPTPALLPPAPITMVTNVPQLRPRPLHLKWVTVPGPGRLQITAETVATKVGHLSLAATTPGGEESITRMKQEVTCTIRT